MSICFAENWPPYQHLLELPVINVIYEYLPRSSSLYSSWGKNYHSLLCPFDDIPIGHVRPFCALAMRLVREQEKIIVIFLVSLCLIKKARTEISRQFFDESSEESLQRIIALCQWGTLLRACGAAYYPSSSHTICTSLKSSSHTNKTMILLKLGLYWRPMLNRVPQNHHVWPNTVTSITNNFSERVSC